jgi:DNA-binding transcriptional MerR regulator
MSGVGGVRAAPEAAILPPVALKLYRAADVCASTGLQPYVLRSWEKEFPGIGVQKSQDSPRLYRQSDVEQVLRIKGLVFGEGLTLSGARRRLEASKTGDAESAEAVEMAEVLDTLGADARARIGSVRNGLRSILEVLSRTPGTAAMAEVAVLPETTVANGARDQQSAEPEQAQASQAWPRSGRGAAAPPKRAAAKKRVSKRI